MPKRTYWDRTQYKNVREVYRPKSKEKKEPYTSRAYRLAKEYHRWRFTPEGSGELGLVAKLIGAALHDKMNSPGFMRMYLHKVRGDPLPKNVADPWYEAYKTQDPGPYKARKAYAVPPRASWERWAEPQPTKE